MVERLRDYLKGRSGGGFRQVPHYFPSGDFLTYYIRNDRPVAHRVDELLTVYNSMDTGEVVGFKIKGIRHILEKAGKFGVLMGDGEVKLGMFFFYLSRNAKDECQVKTYDQLGMIAKDVSISKQELETCGG